ncbi:hypothetical protein Tco_1236944 [Tanacetum coccineum]
MCSFTKKFKEDLFTYYVENGIFQDLHDTSESSNDNTNIVNAPQEPFIVKQEPGENSSQSPPHIDHHCCYECGDSLDDIFCQRYTFKFCGKGAHYGYNCPPKVPIISNPKPCNNQTVDELSQTLPSFDPTCYSGDGNSFSYDSTPDFVNDSPNIFNPPPQPQYVPYSYELCGNDAHHGYDCPPQVPFIMESNDIHCDMVGQYMQKKEKDKRITKDQAAKDRYWKIPICYDDDDDEESSIPLKDIIISGLPPLIEELIPIPSESEGIPDKMCDVPLCDNPTPFEAFKEHSEIVVNCNDDSTLSDDDSPYGEDNHYRRLQHTPDLISSLTGVEIVIPEVGGIDTDILLTIKDYSNVKNYISLPDYEAFYLNDDHVEEKSSEEKPPPSSSQRGLKASKLSHHKSPMLIHGDNTPNLGLPGFLKPLVLAVFVLRSLELQILSFILGIQYPNLIA